jgi:hypothetical protein
VVLPEMLTGMLLEMASGAKSTPKGGLNELLKAHMDLAVASASEPGGGLAVVEEAVARAQEGQLPAQEGAAMGSGLAPREAVVPAQEEELPGEGGDRAARAAARARTREVGLRSASHELVAEPPEEDGDAGGGGPLNAESKAGLFGKGPYKDEPWGLVAMRKRIYSCRKFYERWLVAPTDGALRDLNPGWHSMVTGTLDSLALLIGLKPVHVPKALSKKQLAAMVGAADADNPVLVGTAAYLAKNVVDANRARTEWLLEWEEVQVRQLDGKVVGVESHIGQTKSDRLQKGKVVPLPCTSDCVGTLVLDDEGRIDAASLCPPHLLIFLKQLWANKLEVNVEDVKGPLWSDMARFDDEMLHGQLLIAVSDTSPAYMLHLGGELPGVIVMTREEEKVSGLTRSMFFEVDGQPYAVRAWGDAQHVTMRLRSLAIAAQQYVSPMVSRCSPLVLSMTRVVTGTHRHADILSYGYAVRFIAMLAVVISHMWVLSLHAQGSMVTVQLYQLPTQYPGPRGASMLARPS